MAERAEKKRKAAEAGEVAPARPPPKKDISQMSLAE